MVVAEGESGGRKLKGYTLASDDAVVARNTHTMYYTSVHTGTGTGRGHLNSFGAPG